MNADAPYPSVIIPNVFEYAQKGMDPDYPALLLARWRRRAFGFSDAALFWAGDDKLVVSPRAIDNDFVQYVVDLLSYKSVTTIVPQYHSGGLCSSIAEDRVVLSEICNFVTARGSACLRPWGATKELYLLVDEFRRRNVTLITEELPERDNYWSCSYIDSKVGFRELCTKLRTHSPVIQIPEGFTCDSLVDALEILRWFYSRGLPCVLKSSSGVGGFGNVFLHDELLQQPFETVVDYVMGAVEAIPYFRSGPVLVEELIVSDMMPRSSAMPGCTSSVFMSGVILSGGELTIIGGGVDMRDSQCHYVGAELGKDTYLENIGDYLLSSMKKIGETIASYGYRGHWGVNFMVSKTGAPVVIELNARRCGESHAYALAERLYGEEWRSDSYIITRFPYPVLSNPDVSVPLLLQAFDSTNAIHKRNGVLTVPTQVSWLHDKANPGIGYVVIGATRDLVKSAEHHLHEQLTSVGIKYRDC